MELSADEITKTPGTLDRIGIAASSLCAVHCMLSPLIALAPMASIKLLADERAEWLFVGCSITIGALSLFPSYLRRHGRSYVPFTFVIGATLVLAARLGFDTAPNLQGALIIIGTVLMVTGHVMNIVLCRLCPSCIPRLKRPGRRTGA